MGYHRRSFIAVEQGVNALASVAFFSFLLIQLGDIIPAWHRYPNLRPLAHRLRKGEEVEIHAHVVAGRSNGFTVGGHIMEAYGRPTLEVMLSGSPSHLQRKVDQNSGLALISI